MSLNYYKSETEKVCKSKGWDRAAVDTVWLLLTEEVGEVARIIARRYGEQSEKESDKNKDLGDEMADVLFVLLCLANQTGVDLTKALEKNLGKKTQRDNQRHKNNPKLR